MKQPELGKKISELRKEKGLTQEELVEKCNISVRTLQRIETGDVTPRSYTVKTILAALDYDLNAIRGEDEPVSSSAAEWLKDFLLIGTDGSSFAGQSVPLLNVAWISGIVYFLVGFLEGAAEYFRYKDDELIYGIPLYVVIKICYLISFVLFMRGFIFLGIFFRNYLLRITSYFLIFGNILIAGYDVASIFYDSIERQYILGSEAIVFGCIGILYGVSLRRLQPSVGAVAIYAGLFEIIGGCFFLTVVLSFLGFIVSVPAELFSILLLYKSVDIVRSELKTPAGSELSSAEA